MTNIIPLFQEDPAINPDTVLEKAIGQYDSVIVIGWNKDKTLDARASLNLGHAEIHWMLSVFQNKLLNGDYSAEVERLNEMAERLEERGTASLNQERKANTQRRAGMAARAEAAAQADIALAKTMRNIASAIDKDKAKFLDRVRQKTQVEMLQSFVSAAQYDKLRKLYPNYGDYEKHQGEAPTKETADYAQFPSYTAYRSDLASLGRSLLETDGTKKLGQQLMSVADDVSDVYLQFAKDNLLSVSRFTTKDGLANFVSKQRAGDAIYRSGLLGKAIVLTVKRGDNRIILSPSEAIKLGIWKGDNDKRITLSNSFGAELVEKIGKAARLGNKVSVPWQFENAYDKQKRLSAMGIETPAELRAALREFIGLREAPKEADKIKEMERAMIGRANDGLDFFPTPAGIADEMIEAADIKEGMSVLEPSAGMGHIAERIRESGTEPDVVELSNNRKELLEAKGFNVVGRDFMDVDGSYDRIIMNPPFGDRRDALHVQHAYDLLNPGGRLVAIMGEGVFFGSDKKAQAFRDWLDQVGGTEEKLAEGTFLDSSLPVNTGVNARLVVIDKPESDIKFSRTNEDLDFIQEVINNLADVDELFRHSVTNATTIRGAIHDIAPEFKYVGKEELVDPLDYFGAEKKLVFKNEKGSLFDVYVRGDDVWIDVSKFNTGEGGSLVYWAVGNYAHNTGKVFIADPDSLSDDAAIRRTSAMLSLALRFGTTDFMEPGTKQLKGIPKIGVKPLKWQGTDVDKVKSLIDTFMSNLENSFPELKNVRYDFGRREFVDRSSRPVLRRTLDRLRDTAYAGRAEAARAGEATARRGIFLQSLASSESGERSRILEQVLNRNRSLVKNGNLSGMFSTSQSSVQNPHTEQSLTQAIRKTLDAKFGKGWFNRLLATGKFKVISRDAADGIVGGRSKFHRAFHGSPHDHDGFDSSKIGSGEGAQAFGFGHYFTDEKEIAEWYREYLSNSRIFKPIASINGVEFSHRIPDNSFYSKDGVQATPQERMAIFAMQKANGDKQKALEWLNNHPFHQNAQKILDRVKLVTPGKLYEVELAPSQDEYLDWDKPLSEQSDKVKSIISNNPEFENVNIQEWASESSGIDPDKITGKQLYSSIEGLSASDKIASSHLHSIGIRGIRYKAEGGKSDVNNYVIFDDNDIKIEAKYSKNGDIVAFYNPADDTAYFVYDNISKDATSKQLLGLVTHEVAVHQLNLLRSEKDFQRILQQVKVMSRGSKMKEAAARVPKDTKPEHVTEEILSYFIEANPSHSFTQKVIKLLRKALRAIGKVLPFTERTKWIRWANQLSEGDIISMATSALRQAPDALTFDNQSSDKSIRNSSPAKKTNTSDKSPISVDAERNAANDGYDNTGIESWSGSAYDYIDNDAFKVGTINKKLEAMIAQYANVEGKPRREALAEAVNQYRLAEIRYFNKDGSPKAGAMLAPNGKPTNLTEQQWLQSKTSNFRKWFGKSSHVDENSEPLVINNGNDEVFVNNVGQEKSATGNTGTFNPDSNDIRFSRTSDIADAAINTVQSATKSVLSKENIDTAIYKLQDRFIDLKRRMEDIVSRGGEITEDQDAYQAEELSHKRLSQRNEDFIKDELDPVLKGLHDNNISIAKFEKYLLAKHAKDRNRVMAKRNPNQKMINDSIVYYTDEIRKLKDEQSSDIAIAKADRNAKIAATDKNDINAINTIKDAFKEMRSNIIEAHKEEMERLEKGLRRWKKAQPFQGSEADRLALSGMTNNQSDIFMNGLTAEEKAIMSEIGDKVDSIIDKTLDLAVEYGLETQETVEGLRKAWNNYVPLFRDEAHPEEYVYGVGGNGNVQGSQFRSATGSNADVTNVLAHIAMARERMLAKGEHNKVHQVLAKFLREHQDPQFASVGKYPTIDVVRDGFAETVKDPHFADKENVLVFRENGTDNIIEFNPYNDSARRLAAVVKRLDGVQLDMVENFIAHGTRWMASVNTQFNVVFGLMNLMRDASSGILNLTSTELKDHKKDLAKGYFPAIKTIYAVERGLPVSGQLAERYKEMRLNGGTSGFRDVFADIDQRRKEIEKELKRHSYGKIMSAGAATLQWLSDFNLVMENAVRLSAYNVARNQGLSIGKSSSISKNITVNFNRKGSATTKIGAFFAFYNASVQGNARMFQTLKGVNGKKIIAGGIALGAISALVGIAAMGDDDWEKIPENVRERNLIIPNFASDGHYFAVPLPLGFNMLPNIGRKTVEAAFGSSRIPKIERFADMLTSIIESFNPLGGKDIGQTITPTVADPIVALWRNKDWTGKTIYLDDFNAMKPTPGFTRTKDTATTPSKIAAKAINKLTGGTDYKQGFWSPTPDQIDYVFGQLSGGTWREIQKIEQTASSTVTGEDLPINKIPIIGKLYGETSGNAVERSTYYDNVKRLNEHKAEIEGLRKEGRGTDAIQYIKENPEASLFPKAKSIERVIDKLNDKRKLLKKKGLPVIGIEKQIANKMKELNDAVEKRA